MEQLQSMSLICQSKNMENDKQSSHNNNLILMLLSWTVYGMYGMKTISESI